jgi:hypothetical protein
LLAQKLCPKIIYLLWELKILLKREFIAIIAIGALVASMLPSCTTDIARAADYGAVAPYASHLGESPHSAVHRMFNNNGLLYDESSVVRGSGNVSIRGSFGGRAADSNSWLKGNGSINLESLRSISQTRFDASFTQKSDLVFEGGQLKSTKSLESPLFYKGAGASINERFNLSHVEKSEMDIIRSIDRINNTLSFNTELAFNGLWDIQNQIGSGFSMKKGEQQYVGSFETQKKIEFNDVEKK